jgi:hypothetical protein
MPARAGHTARDMIISLVVLLIPVAIIAGFIWARGGDDVVVTDPSTAIAEAQSGHAFTVAVPTGLASDWRTVSAQYTTADATLRLGYITPAGRAVQLVESSTATDTLLIQELGDDVRPTGVVSVGSAQWNAYDLANGQRAIVLPGRGRTIVIVGNADSGEMSTLAGSLR